MFRRRHAITAYALRLRALFTPADYADITLFRRCRRRCRFDISAAIVFPR